MPNTESAKRALRKAERRQIRNKSERSTLKTTVKKVRVASDLEQASGALQVAIKKLDQAADKHLIHANKAARLKSRLTKRVNKLAAAKAATPPAS